MCKTSNLGRSQAGTNNASLRAPENLRAVQIAVLKLAKRDPHRRRAQLTTHFRRAAVIDLRQGEETSEDVRMGYREVEISIIAIDGSSAGLPLLSFLIRWTF